MQIKLMPDDVIVAVKEYMLRRGLPNDVELEVFVRGGRRGNSGTAEVTIVPKVGADIAAPKIYENVFVPVEIVESVEEEEEFIPEPVEPTNVEPIHDEVPEPEQDPEQVKADMDELLSNDEEDEEVFSEPVVIGKKTLGSMFGGNSITDDVEPTPIKKSANPFK